MSLSEAPSVNIKYNTAQDISDEIMGATIQFCRGLKYKQNIIMLSFFWAAFLLSSKDELEEQGIINDVKQCFTCSLSKVFPKLKEDVATNEKSSEICKKYFDTLSVDFVSMRTESEIKALLEIAAKLNEQSDNSPKSFPDLDECKKFSQISSNIRSSIYRILRQIDNGMCIEYKGILNEISYARISQETSSNKQSDSKPRMCAKCNTELRDGSVFCHRCGNKIGEAPSASNVSSSPHSYVPPRTTTSPSYTYTPTHTQTNVQKKGMSPKVKTIIIIAAIVFAIILIVRLANGSDKDSGLTPVTEPRSGQILSGTESYGASEITITASGGSSCVVKLKTSSGVERMSFYVRAGDTVTVGVPCEYLYVYFASGDTWYGTTHLFGDDTSYSMDDTICNFYDYTWEYTLYPVTSGNFEQTPIDEDEFK